MLHWVVYGTHLLLLLPLLLLVLLPLLLLKRHKQWNDYGRGKS